MDVPRYQFYRSPTGCEYTAALYSADRREGQLVRTHVHDFFEMMYVTEGEAIHILNGTEQDMQAGDLFFIRPDDAHSIHKRSRRGPLAWVNVEFSIDAWTAFANGAGPDSLSLTGAVAFP